MQLPQNWPLPQLAPQPSGCYTMNIVNSKTSSSSSSSVVFLCSDSRLDIPNSRVDTFEWIVISLFILGLRGSVISLPLSICRNFKFQHHGRTPSRLAPSIINSNLPADSSIVAWLHQLSSPGLQSINRSLPPVFIIALNQHSVSHHQSCH